MKINIGISEQQRHKIADGLMRFLADAFVLYVKTRNFHWNVKGPLFDTLHKVFEEQYRALEDAIDKVAERIRALGFPAPGSYQQFAKLSSIPEETGVPDAKEMIKQLVQGHEATIRTAREFLPEAQQAHDEATANLLTDLMEYHEKVAWMLRSFLEE